MALPLRKPIAHPRAASWVKPIRLSATSARRIKNVFFRRPLQHFEFRSLQYKYLELPHTSTQHHSAKPAATRRHIHSNPTRPNTALSQRRYDNLNNHKLL